MTAPQILKTEAGDELVVLTRRDYDALLARLGDEGAEDRMTVRLASEGAREPMIPVSVWADLESGTKSRLALLRRWRGMTQVELADAAGIHQSNISAYESGVRGWSGETQVKLARALRVPAELLVD